MTLDHVTRENVIVLFAVDFNECGSDPCMNEGACFDDVDSYSCQCQPGFTGTNCEGDVTNRAAYIVVVF